MQARKLTLIAFSLGAALALGTPAKAADLPQSGTIKIHGTHKGTVQTVQVGEKHAIGAIEPSRVASPSAVLLPEAVIPGGIDLSRHPHLRVSRHPLHDRCRRRWLRKGAEMPGLKSERVVSRIYSVRLDQPSHRRPHRGSRRSSSWPYSTKGTRCGWRDPPAGLRDRSGGMR